MEENRIYNGDFLENGLPDHCADLIVADPPYYRVKGDFDRVWDSFGDYLKDVERWASELARLLSHNGTLVWFGSWRGIAYCQTILDRSFHLINSCTVRKRNSIQNLFASPEAQRSFFTNDERFLIYESNSEDKEESLGGKARNRYRTRVGLLRSRCMKPLIDYLNRERERAGFTVKRINEALATFMASHWFTYKSQWELPTRERYEELRALFNGKGGQYLKREYEELKREYEELKREYEELRRPFVTEGRQTDVFDVVVDSGLSSRLGHPTVKDTNLIRMLVRALSRPGQLVLEPFAGSGTACFVAAELGRRYIGYEIDPKYWEVAERRLKTVQMSIL